MNANSEWPDIIYEQAWAACKAGQKLHVGGRIYLARPVLPKPGEVQEGGPAVWVTDERTPGDHGLLLFPDGRAEVR